MSLRKCVLYNLPVITRRLKERLDLIVGLRDMLAIRFVYVFFMRETVGTKSRKRIFILRHGFSLCDFHYNRNNVMIKNRKKNS